jgi:hypothetical protein
MHQVDSQTHQGMDACTSTLAQRTRRLPNVDRSNPRLKIPVCELVSICRCIRLGECHGRARRDGTGTSLNGKAQNVVVSAVGNFLLYEASRLTYTRMKLNPRVNECVDIEVESAGLWSW